MWRLHRRTGAPDALGGRTGTVGGRALSVLPSAALCALLCAAPAHAQVLSIGDDGAVVRHEGPAQYLSVDLTPHYIAVAAPGPAAAIRPAYEPRAAVAEAIRDSAQKLRLDPALLTAVAWQESRFRADALSAKGALGVMQLMPATARGLGVDPRDLRGNVEGGAAYLSGLLARYRGDLPMALAAYNAGPQAVERHGGQRFPETQAYVTAVLQRLALAGGPTERSPR